MSDSGHPPAPTLVLASSSPRRREVMAQLGLAFEVDPPDPAAEASWDGLEDPGRFALRTAAAKAQAVVDRWPDALVLAADTIVTLDDDVLGKPADHDEARTMLRRLAGRTHRVLTAVAVVAPGGGLERGLETTEVRFRAVDPVDFDAYVETGEPLDKAGAYGIQGYGAVLVEAVHGCYFNVMGFPVSRILATLERAGFRYAFPGRLHPLS